MEIKKYAKDSKSKVEKLLNLCFERDIPFHLLNHDSIVLAVLNDNIVGLAGYTRSELHSKVVTEYICTHPNFRRQKIATALHEELYNNFPLNGEENGVDICCYNNQKEAQKFK
jgi:GNAT superfamily N-acetyltransferase